jgi:hypothetical protein
MLSLIVHIILSIRVQKKSNHFHYVRGEQFFGSAGRLKNNLGRSDHTFEKVGTSNDIFT